MTNGTNPINIDGLIMIIQRDFPTAGIRITGRARTIRRQAELMAERIRANRQEFLNTYRQTQHIREMNQWITANRNRGATLQQTINAFEGMINGARARGAIVSNHLSNTARDISWPVATPQQLNVIEARMQALGATVIREPNAAGGRHWHVDW